MSLDVIAVAPALFVLHDVSRRGQVGDDIEGAALGDAQRCGDVAQANPGFLGDADQCR